MPWAMEPLSEPRYMPWAMGHVTSTYGLFVNTVEDRRRHMFHCLRHALKGPVEVSNGLLETASLT